MAEKLVIETNFSIKVAIPNSSYERQILQYLDFLTISLSDAVSKLNLVSASCYKPTICIHHKAAPEHWAIVKISGNHKISDSVGTTSVSVGSVGRVRNQPPAWYNQSEEIAYANAVANFNQGKLKLGYYYK